MESNNELKEIGVKNSTCYQFDSIININDLDLDNILLDEPSYESVLIYDVTYKTPQGDRCKVDRYIRKKIHYDKKYEKNFYRITHLVMLKRNTLDVHSCQD